MRMKNYYRLTIEAKCPVDQSKDVYRCVVQSKEVVEVEKIIEAVKSLTVAPLFQEHLTIRLAAVLKAQVKTYGIHSGIETVCICKP